MDDKTLSRRGFLHYVRDLSISLFGVAAGFFLGYWGGLKIELVSRRSAKRERADDIRVKLRDELQDNLSRLKAIQELSYAEYDLTIQQHRPPVNHVGKSLLSSGDLLLLTKDEIEAFRATYSGIDNVIDIDRKLADALMSYTQQFEKGELTESMKEYFNTLQSFEETNVDVLVNNNIPIFINILESNLGG